MADLVSTVDGASLSVAGVVYSAVYAVLLLWAVAASAVRAHHGGRFKAAVAVVLIAYGNFDMILKVPIIYLDRCDTICHPTRDVCSTYSVRADRVWTGPCNPMLCPSHPL